MSTLAKLMVELGLDTKEFDEHIKHAHGSLKVFAAAVVGAGVVVGAGLFEIGKGWHEATNDLIVTTGASGKALTDLQDTTKDVFKSIPTSMATAAHAVGLLSVKTNATGKDLDELAKSEIELARITKTDLTSNITESAKIFNVFGIAAKDQVKTLDGFFRASQQSGVGVDQLMQEVEQFSPVLKAMGLSAGSGALLIGKLDKAGLHTSQIMMGLKKSLSVFAKAGISDIHGGLTTVFNDIKNNGDSARATAEAVKYFGAKAGPELAQAIREGTISVDDLTGAVDGSGDSILGTADRMADFSEHFKIFRNNVEAALIPLGAFVFSMLDKLIPYAVMAADAVSRFATALGQAFDTGRQTSTIVSAFPAILQPVILLFLQVADAAGDVFRAFGKDGLSGAFSALGPAISQVLGSIADLAGSVVDLMGWTLHIGIPEVTGWIKDIGYDIWSWMKGKLGLGPAIAGDGTGGPATDSNLSLTDWVFDVSIPGITGWVVDIGYDIWGWLRGALGLGPQITGDGTGGPASDKNISLSDWVLDIAIPKISAVSGDVITWIQNWIDKHPEVAAKLRLWVLNLGDPNVNVPNLDMAVSHEANKRSTTAIITDWYLTLKGEPKTQGNQQDTQSSIQKWIDSVKFAVTPRNIVVNTPIISEIIGFPQALNDALNALEPVRATLDKAHIDFSSLDSLDVTGGGGGQFGFKLGEQLAKLISDANVGQSIADAVSVSANAVADWTTSLYSKGVDLITGMNNGLAAAWPLVTGSISGAIAWVLTQFATAQTWLNGPGQLVITGLNDGLAAAWHFVVTSIQGAISWVITQFGTARTWLYSAGSSVISGLNDGMSGAWYLVQNSISGAVSYITGAFSGVDLFNTGYNIMYGLYSGMLSMWNTITGWLGGLNPANYKGPPARDAKMLVESGVLIMRGLGDGLDQGWDRVTRQLSGYSLAMSPTLGPSVVGGSGSGSGSSARFGGAAGTGGGAVYNQTFTFNIDGSKDPQSIADEVFAKFSRSLQLQGAA